MTLQLLAIVCLFQTLLGRAWILEQPAGSDMFRASALRCLTGADAVVETHDFIFDQCMLGANSDGIPTKKATELRSNRPFHTQPPRCDGGHQHCILRGHDSGGSRTAQAAVYPQAMCDLILKETTATSSEIRSGGRAAEINTHRLRDVEHHQHTLKHFPEMRLLAQHRGQEILNVFDALVKPWVANAMGCGLTELRYDGDLSQMHIVSLPEVHGANMLVNKLNLNLNHPNHITTEKGKTHAESGPMCAGACDMRLAGRIDGEHVLGERT